MVHIMENVTSLVGRIRAFVNVSSAAIDDARAGSMASWNGREEDTEDEDDADGEADVLAAAADGIAVMGIGTLAP